MDAKTRLSDDSQTTPANASLISAPEGEIRDTVRKLDWYPALKRIVLEESGLILELPRSACVSKGDPVIVDQDNAWVECGSGRTRILPTYTSREHLKIGGLELEFVIKEITELEELNAYHALSQFHYRGHRLWGRVARLIVRSFHPVYPQVVGFIELTTPFYMNKARAALLDAPFDVDGISWSRWDKTTTRKNIHLIVRVARCVVYPEFRGLGLGQVMLHHAAAFARERWQIALQKPMFLEISADMLKYVPFAEKAGMVFIGETQGNLERIAKDMAYLVGNRARVKAREIVKEEASGIVDKQVWRMDRAATLMAANGWTLDDLIDRLQKVSARSALRDLAMLNELVALPKPTFLQGLTECSHRFVVERSATIQNQDRQRALIPFTEPLSSAIELHSISLTYRSQMRRTKRTHAVQQAFGISPESIEHDIIRSLKFSIKPGDVVLVTGPSGSGKTTFIELLANRSHSGLCGEITWPENYRPGVFAPIRSNKALIDVLGLRDVGTALHLMGLVGLSDAYSYLKRFDELSNGQQYRAMLARLIASNTNVWIADEFTANLDSVTAAVVADRMQRHARRQNAVFVAASSQPEIIAAVLRPDWVVVLTTAWEHRILPGENFLRSLPNRRSVFRAPTLSIAPEYLSAIRAGRKQSTIRLGRKSLETGLLLLTAGSEVVEITVTDVRHTRLSCLTDDDAQHDGFDSLDDLIAALKRHYPSIKPSNWITVVEFAPLPCGVRSTAIAP